MGDRIDVQKLLGSMREQLQKDEAEGRLAGLSVKSLTEAISHPKAPEVIAETLAADQASVGVGDPAPDFTLPWLSESAAGDGPALSLSSHFGARPVALIFGSYT